MKTRYEICLTHFVIEEGRALAAPGSTTLNNMGSLEVLQILMIFQDISPVQNFAGEPTIIISSRRGDRHLVRTDLNKLILSDPRAPLAPSRVLEAASILLEIEDQTGRVRKQIEANLTDAAQAHREEQTQVAGEPAQRIKAPPSFIATTICLAIFGVALLSGDKTPVPVGPDELITSPQEVLRLTRPLIGTYVTGVERGDYAITLYQSGKIQFLELGDYPPSERTTYFTLGYSNKRLCIATSDFQLIIAGKDKLTMGNLVFTRQ